MLRCIPLPDESIRSLKLQYVDQESEREAAIAKGFARLGVTVTFEG